jgi:hypothetical protein
VRSETLLKEIASGNEVRNKLKIARTGDVSWYVRENHTRYANT